MSIWSEILRMQIDGSFYGPSGDYPAVLGSIDGLTASQAVWRPVSGQHSIWQIVNHLTAAKDWRREIIEWADSGSHGNRPKPAPWREASGDTAAWQEAIGRLKQAHERMKQAIMSVSDEAMLQRPIPNNPRPRYALYLSSTSEHDAYHAGQGRYIRALQGA